MINSQKAPGGPFRARDGMIMGVCKGLADYLNIRPLVLRLVAVLLMLATAFWPVVLIYLIIGFILKPEPVLPLNDDGEREFYSSYAGSRKMAITRLKGTFDRLDRRIRRLEDRVTSRDFDWQRRFSDPKA